MAKSTADRLQEKPRVAIISRLFPLPYKPHAGGFNQRQFAELAQRYRVSLLVPVPFHQWLVHRKQLAPIRRDEIDVRYAGWAFPPKVARALYPACFGLSLLPELARLRRFEPACLLVSWGYPDAVGAAALNGVLGVPMVLKLHGSDLNLHAQHPLHAAQLRWAAHRAAAVVCVSEALRQRAISLGLPSEKLVVIRNGVDTHRFRPMPRDEARRVTDQAPDRRTVLFVGNVLQTKGVRELLSAFERLSKLRVDLDLVVVGDGPERTFLQAQARAAGLDPRVRLTGVVPHSQLGPWFNAADVVCLPSYAEGLPNVLMEAMACGIPCVATRVGGIPEVVTAASGELVAARDVEELAGALARVLDRTWDRESMVRAAARFSWQANADAMSRVIDAAIAGARSGR